MKVNFTQKDLAPALSTLAQACSRDKNSAKVLANVKIEAKDVVEMTTTDNSVSCKLQVPAKIQQAGATTVNATRFNSIVSTLDDDTELEISMGNSTSHMQLKWAKSIYKLATIDVEQFPQIKGQEQDGIILPGPVLRQLIGRTWFATDNASHHLQTFRSGLRFELTRDTTRSVATDGRLLSVTDIDISNPDQDDGPKEMTVIVPHQAVRLMAKTFGQSPSVKVSHEDGQIIVSDDNISLAARLLPSEYPQYEQLLDQDKILTSIETDRQRLAQTISRVSHLSSGQINYHKILLATKDQTVHVSTWSKELGEAEETVVARIEGPAQSFSLNSAQLKGALLSMDSSEVRLQLGEGKKPIILHPAEDQSHLVVLSQYS